jgi:hypothetical protein
MLFKEGNGKYRELESLSQELERQAEIYTRNLGIAKDDVMNLVDLKPSSIPRHLNRPIVVLGTSVQFQYQLHFAKIDCAVNFTRAETDNRAIVHQRPHLVWMNDGTENVGQSVNDVYANLKNNERPATIYDGVALAIVYPDFRSLLREHGLNFPGTTIGVDVPSISLNLGRPCFSLRFNGKKDQNSGTATCGG